MVDGGHALDYRLFLCIFWAKVKQQTSIVDEREHNKTSFIAGWWFQLL